MTMRFIQIGNRIVNLDQITSAEYTPEDVHPSNPPRVYSSLSINYASDSFNYSIFYEKEADKLWKVLRQNATLNLKFPNQESAIADLDPLPLDILTSPIE